MNITVGRVPPRSREEISGWLQQQRFTHFITLTTHNPSITIARMRERLKQFDARLNRALYGPKWASHKDQLIWFFAFIESPETNPHWHLLLTLDHTPVADKLIDTTLLEEHIRDVWLRLAPAGTVDVKEIHGKIDGLLTDYVGKQLVHVPQYSSFVTPDEFRRL
ncbi:MAG: hypothetical protein Q8K28_12285 [Hoeflea sp.]|uniref:hypothetical protein n=1 Tax=Hoeflea sp. TaxID=1940281 RepID=UPI00272F7B1F|nr:hypothetical protein [Hoeflea sp.]MDP2120674.1 hypothetical protein [Hoeflea sp.]